LSRYEVVVCVCLVFYFFFFQAEDGIRDFHVTGVQTCALPILTIAKAGVNQSFSTHNTLLRPQRMEMRLLNGPFSRFSGIWTFQALSDTACKVTLEMEFEMSNRLAGAAMGMVFKQIANMMVDASVKRAKQIYG